MYDVVLALEGIEGLEEVFGPTTRASASEEVEVSFGYRVAFQT